MTDREFWEVVWRALKMVESAIARKYDFGPQKGRSTNLTTQELENVVVSE